MPELPRVLPFDVPGLAYWRDARDVLPSRWGAALDVLQATVMEWARATGTREWCGQDPETQAEIAARAALWLEDNPGGTLDEFEATGLAAVDAVCQDPRLPVLRLVGTRGERGAVTGGAIFQNVEVLEDTAERIAIRLFPVMGVRLRIPGPAPRAWGLAAEWFLANPIPLEDGRELRVAELDFPTTRSTSYGLEHGEVMRELWDRVGLVADEEVADGDVPTRVRSIDFRRQGDAPRPIRLRARERPRPPLPERPPELRRELADPVTTTDPPSGGRPRRR